MIFAFPVVLSDCWPVLSSRWEVLGDSPEFMHMDEDIESLQCVCRMWFFLPHELMPCVRMHWNTCTVVHVSVDNSFHETHNIREGCTKTSSNKCCLLPNLPWLPPPPTHPGLVFLPIYKKNFFPFRMNHWCMKQNLHLVPAKIWFIWTPKWIRKDKYLQWPRGVGGKYKGLAKDNHMHSRPSVKHVLGVLEWSHHGPCGPWKNEFGSGWPALPRNKQLYIIKIRPK